MTPDPTRDMTDDQYANFAMLRDQRDRELERCNKLEQLLADKQSAFENLMTGHQDMISQHREELVQYLQQTSLFSSMAANIGRQCIAMDAHFADLEKFLRGLLVDRPMELAMLLQSVPWITLSAALATAKGMKTC